MEKFWKISLGVVMHDKSRKTVIKEVVLDEEAYPTKESALEKIKRVEDDLYGFEIPVRLGKDFVIRPQKGSSYVRIKKLEEVQNDLMDITFTVV